MTTLPESPLSYYPSPCLESALGYAIVSRGDSVDIRGRSSWHWAQTRVAQLVLFWAVLDLILTTLDALTKTDKLTMLRMSLGPELGFLTNPWLAFVTAALALALLTERPPAKALQREEAEAPPRKQFSVVETAAIPFFLAFVCGIIFPAFESSYPNRPQVTMVRPHLRGINAGTGRLLLRRQRPAGVSSPVARGSGAARREPLAASLPELTPALDPTTDASAGPNPLSLRLPPEPMARAQSVSDSAARAEKGPSQEAVAGQNDARKRMEQAERDKNWRLLASLSESAIADHPQWTSAYWYAGEAYTHLGEPGLAVERLQSATQQPADGSAERSFSAQAEQLLQTIRQPTR